MFNICKSFFCFCFYMQTEIQIKKKTYTITENDVNVIHLLFLDKQKTHIRSTLYLSELYRVHLLCVLSFSSLSTPGFVKFRFNRQCNWLFNHAIVFSFFFGGGGYIPKIYITRWRQTSVIVFNVFTSDKLHGKVMYYFAATEWIWAFNFHHQYLISLKQCVKLLFHLWHYTFN